MDTLWWTVVVFGATIALIFFCLAPSLFKNDAKSEGLVCVIVGFCGLGLILWAGYKLRWLDRSTGAVTAAIGETPLQLWQRRVAEWRKTHGNTRDRVTRFRNEKAAVLQRLVELGVSRSSEITKSGTARTVAEELRDLVVDIELADGIAKDLDAGIQEMESYVRRLDRAQLLRGREAEATAALRSLDGIEKNLHDIISRNVSYDSRDVKVVVDQEFVRTAGPTASNTPVTQPALPATQPPAPPPQPSQPQTRSPAQPGKPPTNAPPPQAQRR